MTSQLTCTDCVAGDNQLARMLAAALRGHLHEIRTLNFAMAYGGLFAIGRHCNYLHADAGSVSGLIDMINAMEHCPGLNSRRFGHGRIRRVFTLE